MDTPAKKKHLKQEHWRKRNPKKHWAHRATRSAIRSGLLSPAPCEVCGDPKSEAHHPDYDRPLFVVWLCRAHHRAVHYRKGGAA
ncbi:MAG: hypothetical protein JJU15_00360 [Pararhodobacter sp.]|nr:hypothetical protein [Pararhodobacter sp.]